MKFLFNLIYWEITIVVFSILLFYVPVFALTLLGIILVLGITIAVLMWKFDNKDNNKK